MMIEIFIVSSTKNPARQKMAQSRWHIQYVSANGQKVSRDGYVYLTNATIKETALRALADALSRFSKSAVIKVYITDDFVRNMLVNNLPKRWEDNNWRKIRQNGQLQHEELWKYIHAQLKNHAVSYAREPELINNKIIKELDWRMNNVRKQ